MKKLFCILAAVGMALALQAFAQDLTPMHNEKGQFGYGNKETKTFTIKPQWDEARPFNDSGIAIVRKGQKFGLIDKTGAPVGPKMGFSLIAPYDGTDLWLVALGGKRVDNPSKIYTRQNLSPMGFKGSTSYPIGNAKWGLMYTNGTYKIEPKYQELSNLDEYGNIIVVNKGLMGIIDLDNRIVLEPIYDAMTPFNRQGIANVKNYRTKKWSIINSKGQTVIPESTDKVSYIFGQYLDDEAGSPNGVTVDSLLKNKDLWTLKYRHMPISTVGYSWISPENPYISGCKNLVVNRKNVQEITLFDINGNVLIPASAGINGLDRPSEGIAVVSRGTQMGFYDIEKGTFTPVASRSYLPFKNGRSMSTDWKDKNDNYLVDASGNRTSEVFEKYYTDNDRYKVTRGGHIGVIDVEGNEIIPINCKRIFNATDSLYGVEDGNGAFGFVDRNGKTIIPFEYMDGFKFANGYTHVIKKVEGELKGKHGVIDMNNNVVIPFDYAGMVLVPFGTDKISVWVLHEGKVHYYNMATRELTPSKYSSVAPNKYGAKVKNASGKLGLLVDEQEVIPCSLDNDDQLAIIYEYMKDNNIASLSASEARKLAVRLNKKRNSFKLTDKIAEGYWDF